MSRHAGMKSAGTKAMVVDCAPEERVKNSEMPVLESSPRPQDFRAPHALVSGSCCEFHMRAIFKAYTLPLPVVLQVVVHVPSDAGLAFVVESE